MPKMAGILEFILSRTTRFLPRNKSGVRMTKSEGLRDDKG